MKHRKQIFAAGLAVLLCAAMCACGNAEKTDGTTQTEDAVEEAPAKTDKELAYEMSAEAFKEIDMAYQMIDEYGSMIYEAWMTGIYDTDKNELTLKHLADKLGISESAVRTAYKQCIPELFSSMSESYMLDLYSDGDDLQLFGLYIDIVHHYIQNTQKNLDISQHLNAAKSLMKEMSEKYSDYEHYTNLKGYYTTANAFFEWCESPSGSFEQCKTTINDYRNDARDYRNDLAFIFED